MPCRRRISSMFSTTMGFRMLVLSPPKLKLDDGGREGGDRARRPLDSASILLRNLRDGLDNVAITVRHQEVAVGHTGESSLCADENVHPVVILPQGSDLHPVKVARLAQGVHDIVGDNNGQFIRLLLRI